MRITVNGGNGDDQFYIDDTRAPITVNGDEGNDFFQIGQLYRSRRTPQLAGVAVDDVFATIDTTQGWLSNGVSFPMTINGGIGDDNFIVFHNLDVLNLNGDDGNDTFIVQAFALAGSQEDHRALTDLSGGAGADKIQYAVDAPVNIDGGDGFDTVIVIGTEFNDDFVITPTGVFGAGLIVNFVNIEKLVVDGGAGDDRFFVLGTGAGFTTEIDGGLGSDFVSVLGPTPGNGVISNDLLGHSGIITHDVESTDTSSSYNGLPVVGISANVADNDTPGVVIILNPAGEQIVQSSTCTVNMTSCTYTTADGTENYFDVVLTRPPDALTTTVSSITTTSGSKDVTVTSGGFSSVQVGMTVTGTGVPSGTLVTAINGNTLTMSNAATASGTVSLTFGNSTTVTVSPPEGLVLLTTGLTPTSAESGGTPLEKIQNETQVVSLVNDSQGTFQLTLPGIGTAAAVSWDAPAGGPGSVKEAIDNLLSSHGGGTVTVSQTGTTYAITFDGGAAAQRNFDPMTATLSGQSPNAAISVTTSVDGGFSQATAIGLTFTPTNWYVPQRVYYAVDYHAETIAPDLAFNNAVSVSGAGSTIVGNVASAVTVEQDAAHPENDYAVLVSQQASFQNDLPSAALPEGLRGEHLKITSGDPEAEGQVRDDPRQLRGRPQRDRRFLAHLRRHHGQRCRGVRHCDPDGAQHAARRRQRRRRRPRRRQLPHRAARDAVPDERRPVQRHRRHRHDRPVHAEARVTVGGRAAVARRVRGRPLLRCRAPLPFGSRSTRSRHRRSSCSRPQAERP